MKKKNKEEKVFKIQGLIILEHITVSLTRAPILSPLERVMRSLDACSNIDEILIFTRERKAEVERTLKRRQGKKPFKILFSSDCGPSLGDQLREVQSMRVVNEFFLLIRYVFMNRV